MTSSEIKLAEERLRQAEFWKTSGAAYGDWTQWGDLRRNEEYLKAKINLIKVSALSQNRPLSMQEEGQIKELMGQIGQNRLNHINQNVAQPGTREYYIAREREYQLKQLIAFEQEVEAIRNINQGTS